LARWGGLGNQRYQVGFSGDVPSLDWENLALQPYFSATAANVGYGYWSNDITGPGDDMELYLRWV
jgi:alpha-glucosidase (family GH31 glycosyl hydrolase)